MTTFLDIVKTLRDVGPRHVVSAQLREARPPSVNESYTIIQMGRGPNARRTLGKSPVLKKFKKDAAAELAPQLKGIEVDTNKAYMLVLVHYRSRIETASWVENNDKGKPQKTSRWVKQDVGNWRKSIEDVLSESLGFGDQANLVVLQIKKKAEDECVGIHLFEIDPGVLL